MEKSVSVIIPAFNEGAAVANVIRDTRAALEKAGWKNEILVINDGSTDNTGEEAAKSGARVLQAPCNMGYGAALRMGIENSQYPWIATIDADQSYPAQDFGKLLEETAQFDMVIGARKGARYWGSFIKHPARIFFLALAEFVVGENIPDVNSGMRVFKKSLVEKMLPRLCRGFSFSTTITLSFMSSHYFVKFIPIAYNERVGQSKIRPLRDSLRTLQLLLETIVYYNPIKASLLLVGMAILGSITCLSAYACSGNIMWIFPSVGLFACSLILLSLGFILFLLSQQRFQAKN